MPPPSISCVFVIIISCVVRIKRAVGLYYIVYNCCVYIYIYKYILYTHKAFYIVRPISVCVCVS